MLGKLVAGQGYYQKDKHLGSLAGKPTTEYRIWASMLNRCYSSKVHVRNVTYVDCTVSENFKNFQFFAEWCQSQIGFSNKGWVLDKDILIKGNRIYSESNCVFVPQQVNSLIPQRASLLGDLPIGVQYHVNSSKYVAFLRKQGRPCHLGYYNTAEEAFCAYKAEKEAHVKLVSEIWKEEIDPRAYNSLQQWVVNITD